MISSDLLYALLFYSIVLFFVYRNKNKFERQYGIFFLYKTKKGLKFIKRFGEKFAPFINIFSSIGILVSFYFIFVVSKLFIEGAIEILKPSDASAQFALIIPGVNIPGSPMFVPFWYGIISLVVLVCVHELGHAIAAAAQGIKLKSDGFGFLFFLPVFFVEPDEKQMVRRKGIVRMRVAAAGPFANILVAVGLSLVLAYVLLPAASGILYFNGVEISSVKQGFPANLAGIESGIILNSVNNTNISTVQELVNFLDNVSVGNLLIFTSVEGNSYNVILGSDPSNSSSPYMGITFIQSTVVNSELTEKYGFLPELFLIVIRLLNWISFLNLGVGLMNLVPIWVLDGGYVIFDLLKYILPEDLAVKTANFLFSTMLFLFVFNLFGPLLF